MLAETPEIYAAEQLLTRRAVSREVGEKLVAQIRWWENHAKLHGASLDNNPSVGNNLGGQHIFEEIVAVAFRAG